MDTTRQQKVQGGGGGGGAYRGTGVTAPVTITSTTTTHDEIYVTDDDGKEHALRLQNWDLSIRESHRVTAVWLIRKGKKSGGYVAIHNHTLEQTDHDEKGLAKLYRNLWIALGSVAFFLIFPIIGWGLKFILMVAGLAFWWYQGIKGRKELIASGKLVSLAGVH